MLHAKSNNQHNCNLKAAQCNEQMRNPSPQQIDALPYHGERCTPAVETFSITNAGRTHMTIATLHVSSIPTAQSDMQHRRYKTFASPLHKTKLLITTPFKQHSPKINLQLMATTRSIECCSADSHEQHYNSLCQAPPQHDQKCN